MSTARIATDLGTEKHSTKKPPKNKTKLLVMAAIVGVASVGFGIGFGRSFFKSSQKSTPETTTLQLTKSCGMPSER